MLICISETVIVDTRYLSKVEKTTHQGGTKPMLRVKLKDGSEHDIFDQNEIDRIWRLVERSSS